MSHICVSVNSGYEDAAVSTAASCHLAGLDRSSSLEISFLDRNEISGPKCHDKMNKWIFVYK